jgi:hypothetical protein
VTPAILEGLEVPKVQIAALIRRGQAVSKVPRALNPAGHRLPRIAMFHGFVL